MEPTIKDLLKRYQTWWVYYPDQAEREWIEKTGKARNAEGTAQGRKSVAPSKSDQYDIQGVAGEFMASKVYNIPITAPHGASFAEMQAGDVGELIESKTASGRDSRRWNMVEDVGRVKRHRNYVLTLTGWFPEALFLVGWCTGEELMKDARKAKTSALGKEIHIYPREKLKDPITLFEVLREVKAEPASASELMHEWTQPPLGWRDRRQQS